MTPQTKIDKRQQDRRTIMAALVAVLVARLVAQIPALAAALAWVDELIAEAGIVSVPALALLQATVIAAVILLYQKVAQWLGDRWPGIEKIMLGSNARPHYVPRYAETSEPLGVSNFAATDARIRDAAEEAVREALERSESTTEIHQHITNVLSEDEVARITAKRIADKL